MWRLSKLCYVRIYTWIYRGICVGKVLQLFTMNRHAGLKERRKIILKSKVVNILFFFRSKDIWVELRDDFLLFMIRTIFCYVSLWLNVTVRFSFNSFCVIIFWATYKRLISSCTLLITVFSRKCYRYRQNNNWLHTQTDIDR